MLKRKIINGKLYDTETATKICKMDYYNNGEHIGDASLYKTKMEQFFVCTIGNNENISSLEDTFYLVDESAAKEFCEERLSTEDYIVLFGEVNKG